MSRLVPKEFLISSSLEAGPTIGSPNINNNIICITYFRSS